MKMTNTNSIIPAQKVGHTNGGLMCQSARLRKNTHSEKGTAQHIKLS